MWKTRHISPGVFHSKANRVVSYSYDTWGNLLSLTGSKAATLGVLNPLRYRGYVYDEETGLYYVSVRANESADLGVEVPALQIIESGLGWTSICTRQSLL